MPTIALVESCYDLSGTLDQWCQRLATVSEGLFGEGLGAQVWVCELDETTGVAVMGSGEGGHTSPLNEHGRTLAANAKPGVVVQLRRHLPATSFGEVVGRQRGAWVAQAHQVLRGCGASNLSLLFGANPGASVLTSILHAAPVCLDDGERARRDQLAAHMAAGVRLLTRLLQADARVCVLDQAEAIFDATSGQCVHTAHGARPTEARTLLRSAVVAIDQARSRLHRSRPDEALKLWQALVDGRYSLIDHFDSDGRRFLVALANEVVVPDPRRLSLRERQVAFFAAKGYANKLIGYTLGISTSTVGNHLARAMRKLAVRRKSDVPRTLLPPALQAF